MTTTPENHAYKVKGKAGWVVAEHVAGHGGFKIISRHLDIYRARLAVRRVYSGNKNIHILVARDPRILKEV